MLESYIGCLRAELLITNKWLNLVKYVKHSVINYITRVIAWQLYVGMDTEEYEPTYFC